MIRKGAKVPPTKHKCAVGELAAACWLLEQGYEVFRNVSQHGPADLVAWNVATGRTFLIDVKLRDSLHELRGGGFSLGTRHGDRPAEVHLLFVVGTEVVGFLREREGQRGAEFYSPFEA